MTPEDFLAHYAAPLQASDANSNSAPLETQLDLPSGYYYPPYLKPEVYLDTLSRSELLATIRKFLVARYPQQRLTQRHVSAELETIGALENEQVWRRAEMERLTMELARQSQELTQLAMERKRLESLLRDHHAELEEHRSRISLLENDRATLRQNLTDLRASTSWRVTVPLRRLSRMVKASRAPEDR